MLCVTLLPLTRERGPRRRELFFLATSMSLTGTIHFFVCRHPRKRSAVT